MPNAVNVEFVKNFTEDIKKSSHVVVTEYQGLTTIELNELRAELKKLGSRYTIIKNRLAKIAFKEVGWGDLEPHLKGPTAVAYHGTDASAITKTLFEFTKEHKNLKLKAGHLFGAAVGLEEVKAIAMLPNKETLLATLAATLNSPIQNLAAALNEPLRSIYSALTALAKKKQATGAA